MQRSFDELPAGTNPRVSHLPLPSPIRVSPVLREPRIPQRFRARTSLLAVASGAPQLTFRARATRRSSGTRVHAGNQTTKKSVWGWVRQPLHGIVYNTQGD